MGQGFKKQGARVALVLALVVAPQIIFHKEEREGGGAKRFLESSLKLEVAV